MSVLDFMKKAVRRATGKKASRTGLRRVGKSRSHHTCDLCGKTDLKETVVMEGADGARVYYGSECAKDHSDNASKWDEELQLQRLIEATPATLKLHNEYGPEYEITIFHADHGIDESTIRWALRQIEPTGFFLRTLTLPAGHPNVMNALYGPVSGDAPVPESEVHYKKRSADRPPSRMVNRPLRQTRLITIIGMADGKNVKVFTAYGGPAAEREPGDPTMSETEQATAEAFWKKHALAEGLTIKQLRELAAKARAAQSQYEAMGFNWGIDYGVKAGREAYEYEQEIERREKKGEK